VNVIALVAYARATRRRQDRLFKELANRS